MEILTDYKELNGKKIVFTHMAQFADQITIATEDGCILMVTRFLDECGDSGEFYVYPKLRVMTTLHQSEWLREELGKLGVFDIEKYKEDERIRLEKEKLERQSQKEQREKEEYERLKLKFEKENEK